MQEYNKPYPTIGDIIKGKDYDYVEYRLTMPKNKKNFEGNFSTEKSIYAGCFSVENGKINSIDGDTYGLSESVIASEEWSNESVKKGLTVVVPGYWI